MEDRQNAILWINRCVTALLVIRKKLRKSFRDATANDLWRLFNGVEKDGYGTYNGKRRE
jgi:hypothetical protein